jgi:hypothetical protein
VIGGGFSNTNSAIYATIGGGYQNIIQPGDANVIGGGSQNVIESNALEATVAGGWTNVIGTNAYQATIGGGTHNTASGAYAIVPGGANNLAGGAFSFAAGWLAQATNNGSFVWADAEGAPFTSTSNDQFSVRANGGVRFVTGGAGMTIDGQPVLNGSGLPGLTIQQNSDDAPNLIGGSSVNFVSGGVVGATIGGGGATNYLGLINFTNSVTADFGTVGGGAANTAGSFATVGGGNANIASGNDSTVGGGQQNTASGLYATVGGGDVNNASSSDSTVGGGVENTASGQGSTVGGGGYDGGLTSGNTAQGNASVIGGGWGNNIQSGGSYAFIGGGDSNTASGQEATVSGGVGNTASGLASIIPGGVGNEASGPGSFAAGVEAQAVNFNAFVWSDGSATTTSTANNQFMARASGGVIIYSSSGNTAGVSLAAGSGTWSSLSDRNAKDGFATVTAQQVLAKVAVLPLTTWSYKTEPGVRHVGPMAQDFYAAFGVGEDDKHITTVDEGGVALAAIQGLNEKVESGKQTAETQMEKLEAENAKLKQQNDSLAGRLNELEAAVKQLEAQK